MTIISYSGIISDKEGFKNMWTQLTKLRESRGWSKAQLASNSGVSNTYISELESGKKQPTITTIRKLAKALEVPIVDLIEEDNTATAAAIKNRQGGS